MHIIGKEVCVKMKKFLILAVTAFIVLTLAGFASAAITTATGDEFMGSAYVNFRLIPVDEYGELQPASGDEHWLSSGGEADSMFADLDDPDDSSGGKIIAKWGPYQPSEEGDEPTGPSLQQQMGFTIKGLQISCDAEVGAAYKNFKDNSYVYFTFLSGDKYVPITSAKLSEIISGDEPPYLMVPSAVTTAFWQQGYEGGAAGVRVLLVQAVSSDSGSGGGGSGTGSGSSSGGGCSAGLAALALLAVPFAVRRRER